MVRHSFSVKRRVDLGVDIIEADSGRTFTRHVHEQYGIGLVIQGAQRSASGRGQVEAVTGDLISVNPAEVHDGAPLTEARRWQMLYFDPALIAAQFHEITADTGFAVHEFAYPVLRHPSAVAVFKRLYAYLAAPVAVLAPEQLEEQLLLLLPWFVDRHLPAASVQGCAAGDAKRRIDEDPLHDVSLAALAQASGLSRFQLVRAFTRLTGLTPHAYVLQKRIQRARHAIASGMSLAEAAYVSGFADQSHMTRHFVRSFGFAPGVYARQCMQ